MRRLVLFGLAVALGACEPPLPPGGQCSDDTDCQASERCDLATGRCMAPDAGSAGDAGRSDGAAVDLGATDRATADQTLVDAAARDTSPADLGSADAMASDRGPDLDGAGLADVASEDLRPAFYASAGADQQVIRNTRVYLSAATSALPQGATIAYAWTLDVAPAGTTAILVDTDQVECSFVAGDPHGHYEVELVVTVDGVALPADRVAVDVLNTAPVASAGSDQGTYQGSEARLDGTASYDDDGDVLSFTWVVLAGQGSLGEASASTTSFVPAAGFIGTATLRLLVDDGHGGQASDDVDVIVSDNLPPAIGALTDVTVPHACAGTPLRCGATASLEATVTEPENENFTVLWELLGCPRGAAVGGACPSQGIDLGTEPAFSAATATSTDLVLDEAPGVLIAGLYTLRLTATDQGGRSATATVHVTVANTAPTGQSGTTTVPHRFVSGNYVCQAEFSSGLADPDGDVLAVDYEVSPSAGVIEQGLPGITLFRVESSSLSTDLLGPFTITLHVTDGQGGSVQITQEVSCTNSPPLVGSLINGTAQGHAYDRTEGLYWGRAEMQVEVDDANDDPIDCTWSVTTPVSGVSYAGLPETESTQALLPATIFLDTTFASESTEVVATHGIEISCTDGLLAASATDNVVFTNRAPVVTSSPIADAYHGYQVGAGPYRVVFRATAAATDPDGDPVTFTWSLVSPPGGITLSKAIVTSDPATGNEVADLTVSGNSNVVRQHSFALSGSDGMNSGSGSNQQARALNRAPVVDLMPTISPGNRTTGSSCRGLKTTCTGQCSVSGPVSYPTTYSAQFSDPDGDPLLLTLAVSGTLNHALVDGQSMSTTLTVPSSATVSKEVALVSNTKLNACLVTTSSFTFTCDGTSRRDHAYISTALADALGMVTETTLPVLHFYVGSTNWVTCN